MKRFFCFLLTVALAFCLLLPPAYAEDNAEPPAVDFTVELCDILTAGANHLCACITPGISESVWLRAEVSYNGSLLESATAAWTGWGTDTERILFAPTEEPYASYLADQTPFTLTFAIYYKLSAEGEEYGPVIKEATCSYPTEYSVLDMDTHAIYGVYGSDVTERAGWRRNIKYSITATRGTAVQELPFPTAMPVELQVHKTNNVAWTGNVFYSAGWQTEPSSADADTAIYPLTSLTLPAQDTDFIIRNRLYRLSASGAADAAAYPTPEEIMLSGPNAALYVNFVDPGYVPTVALVWNRNAMEAIFDYKPTGAQALEVYTSVDGESWTLSNTVACDGGLPGDIYKNTGYDVPILSQQQEAELLAASHEDPAKQGFYVRLRVIGGALGNRETADDGSFTYTETAPLPWPETYEFEPGQPGDPEGSGGNLGNVGSGGGPGGERPGAPDNSLPPESTPHLHDWGTLQADETDHFYRCSCGARDEVTPHTPDATGVCVVCGHGAPNISVPDSSEPESVPDSSESPEASAPESVPNNSESPEASTPPVVSAPESSTDNAAAGSTDHSGSAPAPDTGDRMLAGTFCIAAMAAAAALLAVLTARRRQTER